MSKKSQFEDEFEIDEELEYPDTNVIPISMPSSLTDDDESEMVYPESTIQDEEQELFLNFDSLDEEAENLLKQPSKQKNILNKMAQGIEEFEDLLYQTTKITAVAKEMATAVVALSTRSDLFLKKEHEIVESYKFIITTTSKLRTQIGETLSEIQGATTDASGVQDSLKTWLSKTQQTIGTIHKDLKAKIESVSEMMTHMLENTLTQIADKVQVDKIKDAIAKQINDELKKIPSDDLLGAINNLDQTNKEIQALLYCLSDESNKDSALVKLKSSAEEIKKLAAVNNKKTAIAYSIASLALGGMIGFGVSVYTGNYLDRNFIKEQTLILELEKMKIADGYKALNTIFTPDIFPNKDYSFVEIDGKKYLQITKNAKPVPSKDGTSFLFQLSK